MPDTDCPIKRFKLTSKSMLNPARTRFGIDDKTFLSIKVKMNGLTISREINQVKNVKSYSEWNTL
jgi:hypothetical protein